MQDMQGGMDKSKMCSCPHHKVVPGLVVLLGLLFLLQALNVLTASFVGLAWPVLVIIAGVMKMSQNMCKCC